MRITDIKSQRADPERDSVYIDGRYAFSLGRELTVKLKLKVGEELGPQLLESIQSELARRHAMDSALRLLSFRNRSRQEVHDRLRRRGVSEALADDVCARLTELGLLDDRRFAETLARDRLGFNLKGTHQIRSELRRKGVPKPVIELALAQAGNEEESAQALLEKVRRRYAGLEARERYRKLHNLLLRRGFSFDVAARVLREEEKAAASRAQDQGEVERRVNGEW